MKKEKQENKKNKLIENNTEVFKKTSDKSCVYKNNVFDMRDFVGKLDSFDGSFLSSDAISNLKNIYTDEIACTFFDDKIWKNINLNKSGTHRIIDSDSNIKQGIFIFVEGGCGVDIVYEQKTKNTARFLCVFAGQNSRVNLDIIATFSGNSFFRRCVFIEKNTSFTENKFILGNNCVLSFDSNTIFIGDNSKACVGTGHVLYGKSYSDVCDNIIHNNPKTHSELNMKGLIYDNSTLVFKGNNKTSRESKESSTSCFINELICSDDAKGYAIPELIINSDECKGEHSAVITPLDKECLLYATSRGYSDLQARSLFRRSFLKNAFKFDKTDFLNMIDPMIDKII